MRTRIVAMAVLAITLMSSVAAHATDIPIDGRRMRMTDSPQPQSRRNLIGFNDPDIFGAPLDPTVTGATAYVGVPGGPVAVIDLPADGWSRSGGLGKDYKFKSNADTVIAARLVDGHTLRLSAHGPGAYALGGTPQTAIGVVIEIGTVRYCGLFGGTIRRDDGKTFLARRAPAPPTCPDVAPTTTTTSSTSTTTEPSTTTTTTSTTEPPTTTTQPDDCIPDGEEVHIGDRATQTECFNDLPAAVADACCSGVSNQFYYDLVADPLGCFAICGIVND